MAKLEDEGTSIEPVIKATFYETYGVSNNVAIANYKKIAAQSLIKKSTNLYVGVTPPGKGGNAASWLASSKAQPAPIGYKLNLLCNLFAGAPGKTTEDIKKAQESFTKALDEYCAGKCSNPGADKPPMKKKS